MKFTRTTTSNRLFLAIFFCFLAVVGSESIAVGDLLNAPRGLLDDAARGALPVLQKTCFVAGTPVLTPNGVQRIEELSVGDEVLSRSEQDVEAPVRTRMIEHLFELSAPIIEVVVAGKRIETTAEHPFFVVEKGWVAANELTPGDALIGHNDCQVSVDSITTTTRHETVYNLRVADDHTYFVGEEDWGFSVWVHNAYSYQRLADGTYQIVDDAGDVVRSGIRSLDDAKSAAQGLNRQLWRIERFDKSVVWGRHKIFRDPDTGLWWSRDAAGHGDSAWKVFREEGTGLRWFKDADEFGNYIKGKHKGSVGEFIPWGHTR